MDVLGYSYVGNQLQSVTDTGDITEGFKDGNTSGEDYDYDDNGNLTQDLNKDIIRISYNYLNLPDTIEKSTGEYIKNIYNAAGGKLAQEVYDASNTLIKRTDYIGEFIYEQEGANASELAIIQHEEGRIVPDPVSGEMVYQYAIRDHLGNTRLMFTSVPKTINFTLNYESDASNADDEALFKNVNKAAIKDFNSTTGDTNYDKSQILYSSLNSQVGSILAIPVGKGDQVTATVNAKYFTAPANTGVGAGSIAASLITAFTSGATGVTEGGTSTINSNFGAGSVIGGTGFPYADANAPKAFLNMMFLPEDESINLVNGSTFSYDQIADGSTEAIIDGISQNAFDVLTIQDFETTTSGYILIYVSNEGSLTDVYFDDLSVTVNESKIIQEASYYPFGYEMAGGYIRTTAKENKFLYQGKEMLDDLGLGVYDFHARMYDPLINRTWQIDPLAEKYYSHSGYGWVANNPIILTDPSGMEIDLSQIHGKEKRVAKRALRKHKSSGTYKNLYKQIKKSDNRYVVKSENKMSMAGASFESNSSFTIDLGDGETTTMQNPATENDFAEGEKGGIITLNFGIVEGLNSSEKASGLGDLAVEEVVHAAQYDNQNQEGGTSGERAGKANVEFEAKAIVGQIKHESRRSLYTNKNDKSANAYGVGAFRSGNTNGYFQALKTWHTNPKLQGAYRIRQRTGAQPKLLQKLIK